MNIKVAVSTDEGESISQHFGQAKYLMVIFIDDNQIISSELRKKANQHHGDHSHSEGQHPDQQMVAAISDCHVLISGGMGPPAFDRASASGLKVILTEVTSIQSAVNAYLGGKLDNNLSLVHSP